MLYAILAYHVETDVLSWTPEQDDVDAALNYVEVLPTEGTAALADVTDGLPTFGR